MPAFLFGLFFWVQLVLLPAFAVIAFALHRRLRRSSTMWLAYGLSAGVLGEILQIASPNRPDLHLPAPLWVLGAALIALGATVACVAFVKFTLDAGESVPGI
jgi:hypothetical protein